MPEKDKIRTLDSLKREFGIVPAASHPIPSPDCNHAPKRIASTTLRGSALCKGKYQKNMYKAPRENKQRNQGKNDEKERKTIQKEMARKDNNWIMLKISTSWSSLFSFQCSDFVFTAHVNSILLLPCLIMYYFVLAVFLVSLHGD